MKLLGLLIVAGATLLQAQTIAIVNRTKSVSDTTLKSVMNAVASQVHNEYKAAWAKDATFVFVGKSQSVNSANWNVYIDDRKGDYHTVTGGVPISYCHVSGVTTDYWTNTISHEVLELRSNPYVNVTWTKNNADGTTTVVNQEVCDACETNDQGYRINSILLSDYVYPSWFHNNGTGPFDQRRLINSPFQILPGGYLSTGREKVWPH